MSNKTGGPAFPWCGDLNDCPTINLGMTLRDYFAAKALPAIYKDTCECARIDGWPDDWRDGVAAEAYTMADAMLRAREVK